MFNQYLIKTLYNNACIYIVKAHFIPTFEHSPKNCQNSIIMYALKCNQITYSVHITSTCIVNRKLCVQLYVRTFAQEIADIRRPTFSLSYNRIHFY